MKDETAPEWLARIGRADLVATYTSFLNTLKRNGSKERRALWDLLAGLRNFDKSRGCVSLERFGVTFTFPVFVEACAYRGVRPPAGAVVAGQRPRAHRTPQVTKWGPKLRNLVRS